MSDDDRPPAPDPTPRYRCQLLRAGPIRLDAGGMFGIIPRVVWERIVPCDDKHRVTLSHNCLLLTGVENDPLLGRPRRIVIETGTGDKLDPKMSSIFGLDGRTVETALREAGASPEEIDDVIVSHLHFDHAGGLTRRCRQGETPDWTGRGSGDAEGVKLTFPNATVHVQELEWSSALSNDSVMTRTYYRDHIEPIADHVSTVESPPPFAPGTRVHRDDAPRTGVSERMSPVLPGIDVFLVPGHTWGQQAVRFEDESGRTIVFAGDAMPTAWHLGAAYSLAYDVEPYTSMITKRWLLEEAASNRWTLALDHEPGEVFRTVRRGEKGWFELDAARG